MDHRLIGLMGMCLCRWVAIIISCSAVIALNGCETTGPKPPSIAERLPTRFENADIGSSIESAASSASGEWWQQFGSEELNALVIQSLSQNAELRVADIQVLQAKIREDQARASRMPTIAAPIRVVEQMQGNVTDSQNNSQVGLTGSYRLDVWGEQRSALAAAQMQVLRAQHDRDNLQRLMIGGLVDTYIAYLTTQEGLKVARGIEDLTRKIAALLEQRLALGDATVEDVERQRSALSTQQMIVASLEGQLDDHKTTLSRYVGVLPSELRLSASSLDSLLIPNVRVGLPSELLFGRPDVQSIEDRMRAADANIQVARARLLPAVDLSTQIGYSAAALSTLLQPQNLVASAVASLAVTIFDGGMKKKEQEFAKTYHEEMVVTYGKTLLQAVREVESALVGVRTSTKRFEGQRSLAESTQRILKAGIDAFQVGAIDHASFLEHQKAYQRSIDELRRSKADLLRSYSNLSVSLGLGSQALSTSNEATIGSVHPSFVSQLPNSLQKSGFSPLPQ